METASPMPSDKKCKKNASPEAAHPEGASPNYLDLSGSTVAVCVGASLGEPETFHVHEKILCSGSEFFKNALKAEWNPSGNTNRPLELMDGCPMAFKQFYMPFLYTQSLPSRPSKEYSYARSLGRAYVLGDMLVHIEFQNAILGALWDWFETNQLCPAFPEVNYIYANTTPSSPARRLYVDRTINLNKAYLFPTGTTKEDAVLRPEFRDVHPDYLIDLLRVLFWEKQISNNGKLFFSICPAKETYLIKANDGSGR